jgi:hypothetical protein
MSQNIPVQKLSAGLQDFQELRKKNCVYVDKTKHIVSLLDNHNSCFLARPRRFGKSLTLSTIEALLSGERQYFNGLLAAEEFLARPTFKERGVIKLDMARVSIIRGVDAMYDRLRSLVCESALSYNIKIDSNDAHMAFSELIIKLSNRYNEGAAILIDEYDKPVTDFIEEQKIANVAQRVLQDFYSVLKGLNKYIYFTLVTGITKITKLGFSSALNHLADISLMPEHADICGYTQVELEKYFSPSIKDISKKFSLSHKDALDKIKFYYDGYSFDGDVRVYNPYSVITLFNECDFGTHWSRTSSPSFAEKCIAGKKIFMDEFIKKIVLREEIADPFDIGTTDVAILLYQSGYLTISEKIENAFVLDYPNQEVMKSMARLISSNFFKTVDLSREHAMKMASFFAAHDVAAILQELNIVLGDVGYDAYSDLAKAQGFRHEFIYREFFSIFMMGTYLIDVSKEVFGVKGRDDIVARSNGIVMVFEIKVAYENDDPIEKLKEAEEQIKERRYADKEFLHAETVTLVSMVVTHKERRITHHSYREVRREDVLSSIYVDTSKL